MRLQLDSDIGLSDDHGGWRGPVLSAAADDRTVDAGADLLGVGSHEAVAAKHGDCVGDGLGCDGLAGGPLLPVVESFGYLFQLFRSSAVAVPLVEGVCPAQGGLDPPEACPGAVGGVLGGLGDGLGISTSSDGVLVVMVRGGDVAPCAAGAEASALPELAVGVELSVAGGGDVAVGGVKGGSVLGQVPFGCGELVPGVGELVFEVGDPLPAGTCRPPVRRRGPVGPGVGVDGTTQGSRSAVPAGSAGSVDDLLRRACRCWVCCGGVGAVVGRGRVLSRSRAVSGSWSLVTTRSWLVARPRVAPT